ESSQLRPTLMKTLLVGLARRSVASCVVVTLLIGFARWFWLSDLLANLRIQVIAAMLVSLGLVMFARQKWATIVVTVCLSIQCLAVLRQYQPQEIPEAGRPISSLLTLNCLTTNRNTDAIVATIRDADADLVALLEVNAWQRDQIMPQLEARYPHTVFELDAEGNFGIALLSRSPLTETKNFQATPGIDSIQTMWNGMLVIATHPLPPVGASRFASRNEHLRSVAERIGSVRQGGDGKQCVVMGDFNVTPWSPIFRDFQRASGLQSAKSGFGLQPTWYAGRESFLMGLVLDHLLVSKQMNCVDYQVTDDFGSDHRGVLAKIQRKTD
ncbi:MAG: endonuclease/exonuclease/phosphatase family protein, partial [Planctomycetota bacterium]